MLFIVIFVGELIGLLVMVSVDVGFIDLIGVLEFDLFFMY